MRKIFCIVFIVGILISPLLAQQGAYQRKSVSSVETVWIKDGALEGISSFDYNFFDKMVSYYIEVSRFDYNQLPANIIAEFKHEAALLTEVTPEKLGEILERTVAQKVVELLNSPEVKMNRGIKLKDEAAYQTFAATKAKSMGLTEVELETLMNSAYIYLPFITSFKMEIDKDQDIDVNIEGGIVWYHIKVDPRTGDSEIRQLLATTSMASGSAKEGKDSYKKFKFGPDSWETTPQQYAQYNALLAWTKNLGVLTKEINAFKLSAQITEARGRRYKIPMGIREGIHLDDSFFIIEYYEDDEGNEVSQQVGFARVIRTGRNDQDATASTQLRQLLGKKRSIGDVVMEHPRLGIDLHLKLGLMTKIFIPWEYTYVTVPTRPYGLYLLKKDATSALNTKMAFAYNLAPIIGIRQTFLDMDIAISFPFAKHTEDAKGSNLMGSVYLGFMKKFWGRRTNLGVGALLGVDFLTISGKIDEKAFSFSTGDYGAKFIGQLEYLMSPNWSFNLGVEYKSSLYPTTLSFKYDETEIFSYDPSEVRDRFPDLCLGGLNFCIGFNYTMGQSTVNLFGFLDPLKKH
jgi:hypothetical protein